MTLLEAKAILEDNGYIVEGKFGRALGVGALALGAMLGNANATEQHETPVKEISSEVLPRVIQKEFGIKNVTLDASMIKKLGEDVKSQIKTDWESFGYDNTRITETDGWERALMIRDTLEDAAPWLCNLFRNVINQEMHNKLKVTPML